ncbi:B12-binding domain-containing radical SAM protein [Candidatus Nitrospira bockiana]
MPAPSVLLLIPPLTQLNTPYPSTAYLTGFLRQQGYHVTQADLGLELVLALFSREGLSLVFDALRHRSDLPGEARQFLALEHAYLDTIDAVVAFLQGRDPSLAPLISRGRFLPQGPRFSASGAPRRYGSGLDDARHLATLYLEDLADLVHETVSPHFALSRYAEQVATSASSFAPLAAALADPPSLTDTLMLAALRRRIHAARPSIVGLTVPFPGNLYGALKIAQEIKRTAPETTVVLGGGYVNTELRRLAEPRLFDLVDYVTLDDGERPLLCLLEYLDGKREAGELKRTYLRADGAVVYRNGAREPDVAMAALGVPTYTGLRLDRYLSVLDSLNPMHRLWSDGHWNKLTVAHGCYWKQCTFCDVGLDYIGRYDPAPAEVLVDRIEALIAETGRRGFHFVDEAAPPAGLKAMALTLLERGVPISWWGNIRFEEAFSDDLCRLLAAAGCIAVSAGLEVASDRLLAAMKKGITVDQTARVAASFRRAGVLVHAYLMYGFPTETVQETIDSLERVRQLFACDLIQSAFWHRFVATAHSPIGLDPTAHHIRVTGPAFGGFAENDLTHRDPIGKAPSWLGDGLRAALLAYKEGDGLTLPVERWFRRPVPRATVPRTWAGRWARVRPAEDAPALERRVVWIGGRPVLEGHGRTRRLILPNRTTDLEARVPESTAHWLVQLIESATPRRERHGAGYPSWKELPASYPGPTSRFEAFIKSDGWKQVRAAGLLLV